MEEWLQHVLQIDPVARAKNFNNGATVLDYLQQILKKKINKIFALHNLQFYSFEVNKDTSLETLKSWISKTMKIPKIDLILLFRGNLLADDVLPDELFSTDDYLFAINKNNLISFPITYTFPILIKQVMKSALDFRFKYLWQLYGQAVYFISTERSKSCLLRCGLQYYVNYLKEITEKLRRKYISASKKIGNLLVRIDCCSFIHKYSISDFISSYRNIMNQQCLIYSGKLLGYLQEHLKCYRKFKVNLNKTFQKLSILMKVWPNIVELVNNFNLNNQ